MLERRYRRVIAVEPLDAMRAILVREAPAAEARAGRAETIPLAGAEVDAVFVAQAFNWFANDVAVAEIARVLRPGGVLAILHNGFDDEAASPLPDAYRDRMRALFDDQTWPPADWREWSPAARSGYSSGASGTSRCPIGGACSSSRFP